MARSSETKTFSSSHYGNPTAVMVTVARTAAKPNAVPLLNGTQAIPTKIDILATAAAVMSTGSSSVASTADVWLSGRPAGITAGGSDTTSNAAPTLAMDVTPGTILTFNASCLTNDKGATATIGPDGASDDTTHMAGSPDGKYNGLQNGIQALAAPQDALIGVFLTGAEPDTVTPPSAGLDHSTSASRAEHSYRDLQNQQPFYIGQGSANSTSQSFVVPKGAIRLYLGVFDGWQTTTTPARCR